MQTVKKIPWVFPPPRDPRVSMCSEIGESQFGQTIPLMVGLVDHIGNENTRVGVTLKEFDFMVEVIQSIFDKYGYSIGYS